MARLVEISKRLNISRSRAIIIGINFVHTLLDLKCVEKVPEASYLTTVLSPSVLEPESPTLPPREMKAPAVEQIEATAPPANGRKRGGWPKGKPRGRRGGNGGNGNSVLARILQ